MYFTAVITHHSHEVHSVGCCFCNEVSMCEMGVANFLKKLIIISISQVHQVMPNQNVCVTYLKNHSKHIHIILPKYLYCPHQNISIDIHNILLFIFNYFSTINYSNKIERSNLFYIDLRDGHLAAQTLHPAQLPSLTCPCYIFELFYKMLAVSYFIIFMKSM